jgi:CubicO group peptidase (beta-lactamase class C family)
MTMPVSSREWKTVPATTAGFSADLGEYFDIAVQSGVLPNLHSVVAARRGQIFLERYLQGPDSALATPLGIVRFGPDVLHDLRSVTKSIVGLLYGIALERGNVPGPDAGLLAQFPEYPDLGRDPDRKRLTVGHALTMTLGTEWDELSLPYFDPRNSEIAMDAAPDRFRYVLERPITGAPGLRWIYNGGATALLARLIAKGTERSLEHFAQEALLEPLGITEVEWHRDSTGNAIAASGLRMRPRDLARIGVVALGGGIWEGRQIIPAAWLDTCFTPRVSMPDGRRYGYHWYLGAVPAGDGTGSLRREETVSAIGNGGQRLFLLPRLDLVVAITAGNYDATDQWRPPTVVLRDVLLPALRVQRG